MNDTLRCLLFLSFPVLVVILYALDRIYKTRRDILRILEEMKKNKDNKYGKTD